jgi:hypothetical protein
LAAGGCLLVLAAAWAACECWTVLEAAGHAAAAFVVQMSRGLIGCV